MKIDKGVPLPPRIAKRVKIGPLPLKDYRSAIPYSLTARLTRKLIKYYITCVSG